MSDSPKITHAIGTVAFFILILAALILVMVFLNSGQRLDRWLGIAQSTATLTPAATATLAFTQTLPASTPTATTEPTQTFTPEPTFTPTATPNANGQIPVVIGYSVEGRPIKVYRFGSGPVKRLIFAGIHGGYEYNTVDLAEELMITLRNHLEMIPPEITLYVLPVLNVDGYENHPAEYIGRPNANGVDLNRNWDDHWQADWDKSGCWNYADISGGTAPFSEPETAALADFMLAENIEAVISYHSAALGIFYGGYLEPHAPSVSLAEAVSAVSPYTYPGTDNNCTSTGMSAHWAAAQGIAAVDIELTNHADTDFAINLRILEVFLHWQYLTE